MKLCISQACTMPATFAEDVQYFADAGCTHMEVWLTKLEKHLESHEPAATVQSLENHGITLVAGSYQGGLLLSQGEARKLHFEHFRRRLELCQVFRIGIINLITDFTRTFDQTDLQRAIVSLKQAAQWAAGFDVRLALEFRGTDTFCSCLETALILVEQCGEPNVGVCLDVFHYYRGSSKPEDLERLTPDNLAFVQVCDIAGIPRELAGDADRVFPGEGDYRLDPLMRRLREIGYTGAISLELFNPILWQNRPTQVVELGLASLRRLVET